MKIFDTIIFFNELDLLEMRLETLSKKVDYFVITESPITFSGNQKPLIFKENERRFEKFKSKIIYNFFAEDTSHLNQWGKEIAQRNSSKRAIENHSPSDNDIVFMSDADEIPNIEFIPLDIDLDTLYICHQDFYYYYFNTLFQETDKPENFWEGSRYCCWNLLKNNTIDSMRNPQTYIHNKYIQVPHAGWHFSFLGGANKIREKIEAYSHQEMNISLIKDNVEENIKNLKDPFYRSNVEIKKIPITEKTHPKYLLDNLEKYKGYIL